MNKDNYKLEKNIIYDLWVIDWITIMEGGDKSSEILSYKIPSELKHFHFPQWERHK